jgi:hypothetical protein
MTQMTFDRKQQQIVNHGNGNGICCSGQMPKEGMQA